MTKLNHECGVIACIKKKKSNINFNAFKEAIKALKLLQHRGQDACGISFVKKDKIETFKASGLVKDNLSNLENSSDIVIAHTRYATTGSLSPKNAQPYYFKNAALCFNGTISNSDFYASVLLKEGFNLETTSDAEILLKWIFYKTKKKAEDFDFKEINEILNKDFSSKAFSLLILLKDRVFAFKDPSSFRPLALIETKDAYFLSSEDCAIKDEILKKEELKAASGVEITPNGIKKKEKKENNAISKTKQCVFEVIYFADKNSNVFNTNVKEKRIELGKFLAKKDKRLKADYVVPVMNSGFWGAFGYSKESGIELKFLIKNKRNLRTFIEKKEKRNKSIEEKYEIRKEDIKGKSIIVVDDSIVRGTSAKKIVSLLKSNGAKEIHFRLTSPKIVNSCFWGVDIPDKNELLAYKFNSSDNSDIINLLKIDSIGFIPLEDFKEMFKENIWCHNCLKL